MMIVLFDSGLLASPYALAGLYYHLGMTQPPWKVFPSLLCGSRSSHVAEVWHVRVWVFEFWGGMGWGHLDGWA